MLLKNNFFIKSPVFVLVLWESREGPLQVPDVRTFRKPSEDVTKKSCAGWEGTVRTGKRFTLFILNEDIIKINDIIKIIKSLEDSNVLVNGVTETVKKNPKKQ